MAEYDQAIMDELLAQPLVAESAKQLNKVELEWLKELFVKTGVYDQYVKERRTE